MNGSRQDVARLVADIAAGMPGGACVVGVCPPFPLLEWCKLWLEGSAVALGAQDVSEHAGGAFTGEVSAAMLKDVGCRFVLVGHSERRSYHRECDDTVARKTKRALQAGLTPVVCVGETMEERQGGQTNDVLVRQLRAAVDGLGEAELKQIVIAYEPVWAIGSGAAATPAMAQEAHAALRRSLAERSPGCAASVKILYGGSMKPDSAAGLLAMPDIDGGLVGGASLNARDFLAIVAAATPAECVA